MTSRRARSFAQCVPARKDERLKAAWLERMREKKLSLVERSQAFQRAWPLTNRSG